MDDKVWTFLSNAIVKLPRRFVSSFVTSCAESEWMLSKPSVEPKVYSYMIVKSAWQCWCLLSKPMVILQTYSSHLFPCDIKARRVFFSSFLRPRLRIIVNIPRYNLMQFRLSRTACTPCLFNLTLLSVPHMWSLSSYWILIPWFNLAYKSASHMRKGTRTYVGSHLNHQSERKFLMSLQLPCCVASCTYKQLHSTDNTTGKSWTEKSKP